MVTVSSNLTMEGPTKGVGRMETGFKGFALNLMVLVN
jgi:hypothetical protein